MEHMMGGVKTKAKGKPKPKTAFSMKDMKDILASIVGDTKPSTTIKKPRVKVEQPRRAPSVRAKTMEALRSRTARVPATVVASVKKSVARKPAIKKASLKMTKTRKTSTETITRPMHFDINFKDTDIRVFVDLFNQYITGYEFVNVIKLAAENDNEEIDDTELKKRLLEVTDLLYFKIRDEIEISLGMRKREFEGMEE